MHRWGRLAKVVCGLNLFKIKKILYVMRLSIVLPARNEEVSLRKLLPKLVELYPDAETIVVNDGSTDGTAALCEECGVKVINHPYSKGNGAAVRTGADAASGDILVFMDADGQHDPGAIRQLLAKYDEGYHMVVGARSFRSQATFGRGVANKFYNLLASWVVGHKIPDLTSGFRVANAKKFRRFLYMLPNGFSYPTTITMAFFRSGYSVGYVKIDVGARQGKSHIKLVRDGLRFLLIIFRVGTLYSPLKLFLPVSVFHFTLGLGYYIFTYLTQSRFTNMSALLFVTSILVFLIGLVSEQVTNLLYAREDN